MSIENSADVRSRRSVRGEDGIGDLTRETGDAGMVSSNRADLFRAKNALSLANGVSNAVGVAVIILEGVSQGAPPEVDRLTRSVSMVFLPLAFLVPWFVTRLYEVPVRRYWDAVYRKEVLSRDDIQRSHRRLLNEPYFLIAVDMCMWLAAAGVYTTVFRLSDIDGRFVEPATHLRLHRGPHYVNDCFLRPEISICSGG